MHVFYVKPVSKTQSRKIYIGAPEDVSLSIINNIHNLSFYFQVKSCLCKINVVILLHSVELKLFVPSYLPPMKGQSRVQFILVFFDK